MRNRPAWCLTSRKSTSFWSCAVTPPIAIGCCRLRCRVCELAAWRTHAAAAKQTASAPSEIARPASYLLPLSGPYWVSRVTWIPVGQIRDQRDSAFLRRLLFLLAPNNLFWLLFCFSRSGPNDRRVSIKPQSIAFLRGSHLSAAEGYMQMSHYRSWRERGKFRDSRRFLSSTK